MRHAAACEFERHDRRVALDESDQPSLQNSVVGSLRIVNGAHRARQGREKPVAGKNAQEGPYQGGGHLVSELFRRASERTHGDNDAQHRGDDPQPGQGVRDGCQRVDGLLVMLVMDLQIGLDHLIPGQKGERRR